MKKILSLLSLAALSLLPAGAQVPPTSPIFPFGVLQETYIDSTFHSVPYAIAFPNTGVVTAIFDPSTSAVDMAHAFTHLQKNTQLPGAGAAAQVVMSNVVNMPVQVQEVRTAVPFSITASTTLTTIPFTVPVYVQTNGHYRFVARLYVVTGSGGSKIDVGGTCNTSNFIAEYQCFAATTLLYGGRVTSFLSGPSGSSTGTGTLVLISGELDVTNGGTFVIQFAQNGSDASASTVAAGSTLTVTQIP